ncbi:MAG: glycosyltransferase family 4 protein [Clostridia bacterium]|nr:glycosyltransferase family 4 protein [Clostridia bacterium]
MLYATPPITFAGVVSYFKKRGAKTYLLLKDIFPQNCVDIGLFSKSSIFYKFFRRKEQKLYALSDYIGTMSQANADYILEHNKDLKSLGEVCPNSEQEQDLSLPQEKKLELRNKYGLPTDKKIVIYGGNLGRPQNIPYFVECLNSYNKQDFYFVIVGGGTDANKISDFALKNKDKCKYISQLPKQEYLQVLSCADVGLILLDSRFTIPNFPSRMLSYLKAKLPIMCLTDSNSDMGKLAEQNGFGYFAISDKVENFESLLGKFNTLEQNLIMGQKGYDFFVENYTAEKAYKIIEKHFKDI